jgi:hypothetical protein
MLNVRLTISRANVHVTVTWEIVLTERIREVVLGVTVYVKC